MSHKCFPIPLISIVFTTLASTAHAEPPQAPADVKPLVESNTAFALALYKQLQTDEGNLFLSPVSVSTALSMTYAGARGETATEMAQVLRFKLEPAQLHPTFTALLDTLNAQANQLGCHLHLANALWAHHDYPFLPEFLTLGQTHYHARLENLDFVEAVEQARGTINTWTAEQTAGKITELIPPKILGRTTKLVLTNAVYFKGQWKLQFDPDATVPGPFTRGIGQTVESPFMHQSAEFGYLETPDLQILELPYSGETLRMVVLLPRQIDGLPALEKALSPSQLNSWLSSLQQRKVILDLPRFRLRSAIRLDETLKKMGMPLAFDARRADFSGMDGTRLLYIGAILHQTYVDVNEEGTEAAGATAVVQKMRVAIEPTPHFQANHPFLFLIRDTQTGSILFMGRLADPTL
ncbi:MAG: serpin family protein [Planctomycetota bacterium]